MEKSIQPNDFFMLITIGIVAMLLFAIGLIVVFFTSQRKLYQEKAMQQEALLFATIETQEKERKRIAKDLHDEIGAKLNVTLLNLGFLKRRIPNAPEVENSLQEIEVLLNTTVDITRRISHNLLPPILDAFGFVAAINELQESYEKTEVRFDFEAEQATDRLEDKMIELNLFRVVQELVKNSILHGNAKHIQLKLITEPVLTMIYQDNGKGFEVDQLEKSKGLGTQNIESRLKMCGAQIVYESSIGQGLKATITKTG